MRATSTRMPTMAMAVNRFRRVLMNGAPSSLPCARRAWAGWRDRKAATLDKGRRSCFLFPADVAAAADAAADAAAAVAAADAAAADDEAAASATLLRAAPGPVPLPLPLPLPLPPLLGFAAGAGGAASSRLRFGRMGRMSDVWRSGMAAGCERRALLYQSPEKKNGWRRKVPRVHTADQRAVINWVTYGARAHVHAVSTPCIQIVHASAFVPVRALYCAVLTRYSYKLTAAHVPTTC